MSSVPESWAVLPGSGLTPDEVELGFVSGVFGVRGEVRLHLHNRESTLFSKRAKRAVLVFAGTRYEVRLKTRSGAGGRVIGTLQGLSSREQAHALKGAVVGIAQSALPQLAPDEFYIRDVLDTAVRVGDVVIGTVSEVHQTGAIDVLEIDVGDEEPAFIPVIQQYVLDIGPDGVVLSDDALEGP